MSHVVEPALAASPDPTAVYDFPTSQAALAQIKDGRASRFEVYHQGVELANGFHELQDVAEQLARFEADQHQRKMKDLPGTVQDPDFLAALSSGLPACSGVALGVDRLFALMRQCGQLSEGVAFEFGSG